MGPELGGRKEPPGDDEMGPHDETAFRAEELESKSEQSHSSKDETNGRPDTSQQSELQTPRENLRGEAFL